MPYDYLEDIGTADIAFEATGRDLPELFTAAADATMNVMIDNLEAIEPHETRRIREAQIDEKEDDYSLNATAAGELLDPARHQQRADVKAVTLHDFRVEKTDGGWKASVLLDI